MPGQSKARVTSRRDKALWALLAILAATWLLTWPLRAKMARDTARFVRAVKARAAMEAAAKKLAQNEAGARSRVAAAPPDASAHADLAEALTAERKYAEAGQELQTALRLRPGDVALHDDLALNYELRGEPDLEIEEFRKALKLQPDNVEAVTLLAYRYLQIGWIRPAERLLLSRKGLQDNPRVKLTLAQLYQDDHDYVAAESELNSAHKLEPAMDLSGPFLDFYRASRRDADALKLINAAMKTAPAGGPWLEERAQTELDLGDAASALRDAQQCRKRNPSDLRSLYIRAVAEKLLGQTAKATSDLEKVHSGNPGDAQTLLQLGQLYLQQGNPQGQALIRQYNAVRAESSSQEIAMNAVRSRPNDPSAHLALAKRYFTQGNTALAIVELKETLALRPGDPEAKLLLSKSLAEAGR